MKQKVFIATPAYDGRVHTAFTASLIMSFSRMAHAGIQATWESLDGCCYIPVARNKLVRSFLESDYTDMLFVDSDVGWDADGLMRLLSYDRPFTAGIVPFKIDQEAYPVHFQMKEDGTPSIDEETGLTEGIMVATAFMRIRREVFELMIEKYPDALLVVEKNINGDKDGEYMNFFDCVRLGERWWGEDARFCRLWTSIGGKIWIDPNIDFTHSGSKTWEGNFLKFLQKAPE